MPRSVCYFLFGILLGWSSCQPSETDRRDLYQLFEEAWQQRLEDSPTFASSIGDFRYNDRWPDAGLNGIQQRHQQDLDMLERLGKIEVPRLSAEDQLNYQLFRQELEDRIEDHRFLGYLIPLNQRGGIQTADELARSLPFRTVRDYQDWIQRIRAFPVYVEQTTEVMREAIRSNMLHPKIIMRRLPAQISSQLPDLPEESPFFRPFRTFPESFDPTLTQALTQEAKAAITESIFPAVRAFQLFFEQEYLPACYDQVGAWQQANGRERYAYLVRSFTTTDLTPEQVHQIGLSEVQRIRSEMEALIDQAGFQGSFGEFLTFLRTDPRFYYNDPNDLLLAYRDTAKRIDPELVKLFGVLPRTPYGVEPIPEAIAPDTTTAYYRPLAGDGSRAGTFCVNLYRPEVRPKYEVEALTVHEAVPGHHLQIALARELRNLPSFRRFLDYTVFVEGWALYAESLGEDLGLYRDPYSRFGQLTYQMWRAVRLVVDTGIHAKRWDREQAIHFFKENAAKTEHDIVNEIDRYIAWPGQALAYKIGELKIQELRRNTEAKLGDRFDIREFHDAVLGSGALPLNILESRVNQWARTRVQDVPE